MIEPFVSFLRMIAWVLVVSILGMVSAVLFVYLFPIVVVFLRHLKKKLPVPVLDR